MSSADHHLYAIIADLQQHLATQAEVLANLQLALSQQQQSSPVRKRQHSSPTARLSWIRLWKKFHHQKRPCFQSK
jgi:hypothetical protein